MSPLSALMIIALFSSFRISDSQTCPDDTLFITCANGGWEDSSSCYSPKTKIIAFGRHPYWSYYEKPAGDTLQCDDAAFGDPYRFFLKRCCKLVSDLSGNSSLSPVVNTIACDETKHDFWREGYASITHFWKFTLDDAYLVTIDNCNTLYDTKMYLRDAQGDRVSDTILGCDGDDCNCGFPDTNEKFINVSLSAGDYYIEILPYDSTITGGAGTYYLSTKCTAAPAPITPPTSSPTEATNIPTPAPTDALSSAPTTPMPTGTPKTFCGKTNNWWCYNIDLYPSLTEETNHTVFITNPQDDVTTYFRIEATVHDNHCINPSILFSFEEIDFSHATEYITLYDNDQLFLAYCEGTKDDQCGTWIDCFNASQPLRTNKINAGESYSIYVEESYAIDALCTQYHPYSINAKLTIICSADSASPTKFPTVDPTAAPSTSPTLAPSNAPSSSPSSAPSAPPTAAPSNAPSSNPSSSPSAPPTAAPSNIPSLDPTGIPSETPTKRPIIVAQPSLSSAPLPSPTARPTDPEAEVKDTDDEADDDDDKSQDDAANQKDNKEDTYVVMIIGSVVLFGVCCVLVICIYYQFKRKKKAKEDRLQKQKSAGSELQLTVHEPVPMNTLDVVNKRQSYASVASDTHPAGGDRITPIGTHHEPGGSYADINDTVTLPRLPSENVGNQIGERDESTSDAEDHDDLYVVPAKKGHTKGGTATGDDYDKLVSGNEEDEDLEQAEDEEDDDDDDHNDLYEKPKQKTTVGKTDDEGSKDSDDDDDEYDDLYGKSKNDEGDDNHEDEIAKEKETSGT